MYINKDPDWEYETSVSFLPNAFYYDGWNQYSSTRIPHLVLAIGLLTGWQLVNGDVSRVELVLFSGNPICSLEMAFGNLENDFWD